MDLSLTESQELIKSTARDFVGSAYSKEALLDLDRTDSGFSDDLWRQVAGLGWLGMAIPEKYGGSGGTLTDAAVLFEEMGRGPVPGPYFSSAVLGALTILEAGSEEQKRSLLPEIAEGRRIVALAVTEPGYGWDPAQVSGRRTGSVMATRCLARSSPSMTLGQRRTWCAPYILVGTCRWRSWEPEAPEHRSARYQGS